MLLGESVLFCTIAASQAACVLRKPKKDEVFVSSLTRQFSGQGRAPLKMEPTDMRDFITTDFKSIPGVVAVDVNGKGNTLRVKVSMRDLEYDTCKRVYAKEIDFYTEFPTYEFDFDVVPSAAT